MILYYSVTSPYSRKVLLLARSLGLGDKIDVRMTKPLDNDPDFLAATPLGKVPVLDTGDKQVFDSPLIAEHLLHMAGVERSDDYLKVLEEQALADGLMDAAVAKVMEGLRPKEQQSSMWLARYERAIAQSFKLLEEKYIANITGWDLGSMAVACALDYVSFRLTDLDWQSAHPKCAKWFETATVRTDMQETNPRMGV